MPPGNTFQNYQNQFIINEIKHYVLCVQYAVEKLLLHIFFFFLFSFTKLWDFLCSRVSRASSIYKSRYDNFMLKCLYERALRKSTAAKKKKSVDKERDPCEQTHTHSITKDVIEKINYDIICISLHHNLVAKNSTLCCKMSHFMLHKDTWSKTIIDIFLFFLYMLLMLLLYYDFVLLFQVFNHNHRDL